MRPALAASLLELLEELVPPDPSLRITALDLDLPLEVALARDGDGTPVLLASPPRWRWTTDFDARPGRLRIRLDDQVAP